MSGERLLLDSTFIAGLINSRDQLHLQAKYFLPLVETAAEVPDHGSSADRGR